METQNAGSVLFREPTEDARRRNRNRNWFLTALAAAVIIILVSISLVQGPVLFASATAPDTAGALPGGLLARMQYLIPYLTCLAGVLLFIMNTARSKRDEWDGSAYFGEHAYRVAQAFAYLFVVWWAWAKLEDDPLLKGTYIRPNILGFLVGFFILRVERAMDGLGDKFEEFLMALLPRAARFEVAEERRRLQVRASYRLTDIATQWEALRPQIADQGARDRLDDAMTRAQKIALDADPDRARHAVDELDRMFQDVRSTVGDVLVPVEELLRGRDSVRARTG